MREKVDYMHIILRGGLLAMVCALHVCGMGK